MTEKTEVPPSTDDEGKLAEKPVKKKRGSVDTRLVTVAATGIGSAALVAALLYANKSRRRKPDPE